MSQPDIGELFAMRRYFQSGETRPYKFRIAQLRKLRKAVLQHQKEISNALFTDLKKSPEESWAAEIGLVIAELNVAIKNLRNWMRPQIAVTDLVNLPSSSRIYRDPLGVVLIIAPWNYPFQLLMIPFVGAIAGGNCVVLKPSEFAPATSEIMGKIIRENFSTDFIRFVTGDGAEVVPPMMKNFRFDHVFYTGSIPVGKSIYKLAAEQLVPVTLELGGKSPAIVEKDANIAVAARRITLGKFLNAGQTCIAPDYVLVHEDVKEKFVDKLKESITKFYTDDPANSYDFGKIINEKRFDKLVSYLGQGKLVHGGEYDKTKLFIAPTVIESLPQASAPSPLERAGVRSEREGKEVDQVNPLLSEEIFGPILPIISFQTFQQAKEIVEHNPNPLAFYLFTTNKETEQQWIEQVSFGGGCINNADWHFTNHNMPFGGVGNSGMGQYHGKFSFDTFTRMKSILKTPNWYDPSIKYPPMKGRLRLFKWVIR